MKKRLFLVFILSLCFLPQAWALNAADQALFHSANEAYRDGKYGLATQRYGQLVGRHPQEAVFQYNYGNAAFRSGRIPLAILSYERALSQAPRLRDAQRNLQYVRGLLEYRVKDTRNWYVRAVELLLHKATKEETLFLAAASLFLVLLGWTWLLFFQRGVAWGWKMKTAVWLCVLCLAVYGHKQVQTNVIRDAIVMEKEVEARYGPSFNDQVAFRLGEGLKVHVIKNRGDWSRILLTNGESGWVERARIAEVRV